MSAAPVTFFNSNLKQMKAANFRPYSAASEPSRETMTLLVVGESASKRKKLTGDLAELGHELIEAGTAAEALQLLSESRVDAVLADLFVPAIGGIDLCRAIKAAPGNSTLPVLILSPADDVNHEIRALEAGADAFLVAPYRSAALRARVQASLRQRTLFNSLDDTEAVLFTLAQSVEERDPSLGQHCERLSLMSAAMGLRMGLPAADILSLQRGGYLHDIGKVALPDNVLLKPGPLSPEQWEVMKTHPERGERICRHVRSLAPVLPIIRHHHEKWDGSGYPDKLRGGQIPLLARILQTADIYDALIATRSYKAAFTSEDALHVLKDEARKGWRDPELVRVLEEILPLFPSTVSLDTTRLSLQALMAPLGKGNWTRGIRRTA